MFHAIANFFRRCCRKRPVTSGVSDLARERMRSGGEALKKDVITQADGVKICLFARNSQIRDVPIEIYEEEEIMPRF